MRNGRVRIAVWGAITSIGLAALALAGPGADADRFWQGDFAAPATAASTAWNSQPAEAERPAPSAQTLAQADDVVADVDGDRPVGLVVESSTPRNARAVRPTPRAVNLHSFGPASETVAPSSEIALKARVSPPAVTSASRPTPAPHFSAGPAPEPVAPPQVSPPSLSTPTAPAWSDDNIRAVRFDAGYYYRTGLSARQLAEKLTKSWHDKGINLVYFYAYNRVYGARYYTTYPGNIMEDYGRQDLLGHMIRAAHKRGIKVIAWFYGPQHKQMWEAHPDWREKMADGRDYKPDADSYFLCVRNPEVKEWWQGLIGEVLTRYPHLDGIDIAEPQVDLWGDHAGYCEHCRSQFAVEHPGEPIPGAAWRKFRAAGLTELLQDTIRLAHRHGKEVHLTTVFTAGKDGRLLNPNLVRDAIGFDLQALLSGADRPDVIQAELIWQQWAALYGDQKTFADRSPGTDRFRLRRPGRRGHRPHGRRRGGRGTGRH